jgi:DeoR/GlpR family transcriptional regulator of sugar metabolism
LIVVSILIDTVRDRLALPQNDHNIADGRTMVADARRAEIEKRLRATGSVSVAEIEAEFGVSPMTARRDLAVLERRRVAQRTHGGAILPPVAADEDSFASRLSRSTGAKRALARAAADLVTEGESVFLDSSSSAYHVARELIARGTAVTVITNSLPILALVGETPGASITAVGVGGALRTLTGSFVGPLAVEGVQAHLADRLFFSTKGVLRDGLLTNPDALEAEVKRAMIARAQTAVLLTDRSKLDARGLAVVARLEDIDLVLAHGFQDDELHALAASGPRLLPVRDPEAA